MDGAYVNGIPFNVVAHINGVPFNVVARIQGIFIRRRVEYLEPECKQLCS
jgi:hypothetical protein